jgi:glycosyltransferase involved in cell wall biosynthesis
LKVLHVIASVAECDGGPGFAALEMVRALNDAGCEALLATTDFAGRGERLAHAPGAVEPFGGAPMIAFPMVGTSERAKRSPGLAAWVGAHARDHDVVHVHGLFSHAMRAAVAACRAAGVPLVVSPVGHLMAPHLDLKRARNVLKRAYIRAVEWPGLREAAAIIFTSGIEQRLSLPALPAEARGRARVASPGLADEALRAADEARRAAHRTPPGEPLRLRFLGRLDPVKGFEEWLPALGDLARDESLPPFTVELAGPPTPWSELRLPRLLRETGLRERALVLGALHASERWEYLAGADLVLLPSRLENFGLVGLEALAAGAPVLLSRQVGCAEQLADCDGAVVAACTIGDVRARVRELLLDPEDLARRGREGRAHVERHCSSARLARCLLEVYESVARNGHL